MSSETIDHTARSPQTEGPLGSNFDPQTVFTLPDRVVDTAVVPPYSTPDFERQ